MSSTFFDLKHVRSSLEEFIDSLGYEPVLSEKGNIAFDPDWPPDESCYREVRNSDIYVLIIGGRYGSPASTGGHEVDPDDFYARYESVTRAEFRAAVEQDIPVYILIDRAVNTDYQTFRRNRERTDINYAHADSVGIFRFIEFVHTLPRNNPVHLFERVPEIRNWLREQWAGWFRELIRGRADRRQIASLSAQVQELSELNSTLKRYLEEVMTRVVPEDAARLIADEGERLREARQQLAVAKTQFYQYFGHAVNHDVGVAHRALSEAGSLREFFQIIEDSLADARPPSRTLEVLGRSIRKDEPPGVFLLAINEARAAIGRPPFDVEELSD